MGKLGLVFDRERGIDVPASLYEDERLTSFIPVEVIFEKGWQPNYKEELPSFSIWLEHNEFSMPWNTTRVRYNREKDQCRSLIIMEQARFESFEAEARKIFPIVSIELSPKAFEAEMQMRSKAPHVCWDKMTEPGVYVVWEHDTCTSVTPVAKYIQENNLG
ncbi:MAG: hypothetical protein DI551_09080 [Micavibrio aeruginosavorus]|uniref:Uncharacterized protein n=1 Tax=Micavibrio aeruginosavorus TaxID=349221 RepID=A0A2W5MXJ7_9BACT|nr:MAG: hypothetical protein DI551_09080 [Micavibrio aeruginosavorus]